MGLATYCSIYIINFERIFHIRVRGNGWELPEIFINHLNEKTENESFLDVIKKLINTLDGWSQGYEVIRRYPDSKEKLTDDWFVIFDIDLEEIIGTFPSEFDLTSSKFNILPFSEKITDRLSLKNMILSDHKTSNQDFMTEMMGEFFEGMVKQKITHVYSEPIDVSLKDFNDISPFVKAKQRVREIASLKFIRNEFIKRQNESLPLELIDRCFQRLENTPEDELLKYITLSLSSLPKEFQSHVKIDKINKKFKEDPLIKLAEARQLAANGKEKKATKIYERILKNENRNYSSFALDELIKLEIQKNGVKSFRKYLKELSQLSHNQDSWEKVAYAQIFNRDLEMTFRSLWIAYHLNPEESSSTICAGIGSYYLSHGEYWNAIHWFSISLEKYPFNLSALIFIAHMLAGLGFKETSLKYAKILINKIPQHPLTIFVITELCKYYGEYNLIKPLLKGKSIEKKSIFRKYINHHILELESEIPFFRSISTSVYRSVNWHRFRKLNSKEGLTDINQVNIIDLFNFIYSTNDSNALELFASKGLFVIPFLFELLKSNNPYFRAEVLFSLRNYNLELFDTYNPIIDCLKDEWALNRGLSAYLVGEIRDCKDSSVINSLISNLQYNEPKQVVYTEYPVLSRRRPLDDWVLFQTHTSEALEKLTNPNDDNIINNLLDILKVQSNKIRASIFRTLKLWFSGNKYNKLIFPYYSSIENVEINSWNKISDLWEEDYHDKNYFDSLWDEKEWFENLIQNFRLNYVEELPKLVQGINSYNRIEIPRILGHYMDDKAINIEYTLIKALNKSENEKYKQNIIFALGKCIESKQKSTIISTLSNFLFSDNLDTRIITASSIAKLDGSKELDSNLRDKITQEILNEKEEDLWIAIKISSYINYQVQPKIIEFLVNKMEEDPLWIGACAVELLEKNNWKPSNSKEELVYNIASRNWEIFSILSEDMRKEIKQNIDILSFSWILRNIVNNLRLPMSDTNISFWIDYLNDYYELGDNKANDIIIHGLSKTDVPELYDLFLKFLDRVSYTYLLPIEIILLLGRRINEFPEKILPKIINFSRFNERFHGVDTSQALLSVWSQYKGELDPLSKKIKNKIIIELKKQEGVSFISPGPTSFTKDIHAVDEMKITNIKNEINAILKTNNSDDVEDNSKLFRFLHFYSIENPEDIESLLKVLFSSDNNFSESDWRRLSEYVYSFELLRESLLKLYHNLSEQNRYKILKLLINFPPNSLTDEEREFFKGNFLNDNIKLNNWESIQYPIRLDQKLGIWLLDHYIEYLGNEKIETNLKENLEGLFYNENIEEYHSGSPLLTLTTLMRNKDFRSKKVLFAESISLSKDYIQQQSIETINSINQFLKTNFNQSD